MVAATDGVQVGTAQMWSLIQEKNLPVVVFISKLDKDNTDFQSTADAVAAATDAP